MVFACGSRPTWSPRRCPRSRRPPPFTVGTGSTRLYIEEGRSYFGPGPTPPNFIDPDTLERRPYLRKDASLVARVCDALPNIGYVQSLGSISDVTNGLADIYEFADMIQNTTKIIMNWSFTRDGCRDEHRVGIAMAGGEDAFKQRPNYIFYGEPISPLVSDYHAIDKCMYCAENRIPQVYSPCAIGGGTVPASHAGQLVVALSESMVGVVVSQLINPGTCIIIGGVQSHPGHAPVHLLLRSTGTRPALGGTHRDVPVLRSAHVLHGRLHGHKDARTAVRRGSSAVHPCGHAPAGRTLFTTAATQSPA